MIWLAAVSLLCALGPALLFARNLTVLRPPPSSGVPASVLIPARDEERNIAAAVEASLRSGAAEVLVLDDGSTDRTAEIVRQGNVARLISGQPLPTGWRGKNFANAQLADAATRPVLIFVDADVRLAPDAAARLAAFLQESGTEMASGVPRQITKTFSEKLLIPLIHFVLLGFLPIARMRTSRDPVYGAGVGQLIVADATAYRASGGHGAIRDRIHDGLALPKNFRAHGFATDLFDATEIATCRMYRTNREVWAGLAKNTIEGLGAPRLIVPMTIVLLLGQVAPFLLLFSSSRAVFLLALVAALAVWSQRIAARARFRQPWLSVLLHPLGIVALIAIQWFGLARHLMGREPQWKGRSLGAKA